MKNLAVLCFLLSLGGCSAITQVFPPDEELAITLEKSASFKELQALPDPGGQIPVTVYAFRDQTGQYKPSNGASSFSTAVTQGATSILMQTLSDSAWFLPVEREGLQNILTERKIVRAAEQANQVNESEKLPPLSTAKMIIEGGIISYDSNVRTGGFGAEYFGIGASELYREDMITVYMRAVDVRTGRVLVSVSSSKKVLSKEIRAGLFRYVSYKRLAEIETGFTTNEPMFTCVQQSIEKATTDLILKGIEQGVWKTKA